MPNGGKTQYGYTLRGSKTPNLQTTGYLQTPKENLFRYWVFLDSIIIFDPGKKTVEPWS